MLTLTQWGIAFDELNQKNVQTYAAIIHSLVEGAIQHDAFQSKIENQLIYLYPKEIPNAKIMIDMTKNILDIRTDSLWKEIEEWAEEEKNAYG